MSTIEQTAPAPLRVLVVENDPQWREDHIENLRSWGYEVYAAEAAEQAKDKFQALWDDAIAKAHRHRCHLALVDMRLKIGDNPDDTSGLGLVPVLAPTVSIIVSAYGDARTVRAALKSPPEVPERAYDFFGKEDGPDALRKAIKEVERSIWCGRDVEFIRTAELQPAALVRRFFPQDDSVPSDEVDDVLRRLFPDARKLKIEVIGGDNRFLSTPPQQRSVVLKVIEDDHARPVIVKLARSRRMTEEAYNFAQVKSYFSTMRFSRLENTVKLWNLGGAIYEFIGGDGVYPLQLFTEYYATHQVIEIRKALEELIAVWRPLYNKREERTSLFRAYCRMWENRWYEQLLNHRQGFHYMPQLHKLGLPDPVAWLLERVHVVGNEQCRDQTPDTTMAMVHGDLHGDNLLVDRRGDVWVIDYERTGPGPIIQDFVELEIDILTRLTDLKEEPTQFYDLLVAILEPITPRSPIGSTAGVMDSAQARKALSVIDALRSMAFAAVGSYSQVEYYWGLLFNALFRVTILENWSATESVDSRLQQLYYLAAMICQRLDNWDRAWPPRQWQYPAWRSNEEHADLVRDIDNLHAALKGLRYQLGIASPGSSKSKLSTQIEEIEGQLIKYGELPNR